MRMAGSCRVGHYWLLPVLLLGCSAKTGSESSTVESSQEPIYGVTKTETGFPAVGELLPAGCTATLIEPGDIILSAAHCLYDANQLTRFRLGGNAAFRLRGRDFVYIDPRWHWTTPDAVQRHDYGFAQLAPPMPTVRPMSIAGVSSLSASAVRVIGYGMGGKHACEEAYPFGTKRSVILAIDSWSATGDQFYTFNWPFGVCPGDSGAPTLPVGARDWIVGIVEAVSTDNGNPHGNLRVPATVTALDTTRWLHRLTVQVVGTGKGTVKSGQFGIKCRQDTSTFSDPLAFRCSSYFGAGTTVEIGAFADAGWSFLGWSGDGCTGAGTTITPTPPTPSESVSVLTIASLDTDRTCVAEFGCPDGQRWDSSAQPPGCRCPPELPVWNGAQCVACPAGATWNPNANPPACQGICTPGSQQCATGNVPQTCNANGEWVTGPVCPYVCLVGLCTGICTPGSQQCTTGNVPQTCNANGEWVTGPACPYVCLVGLCTGICTPGSQQCATGNVPQTCNANGEWVTRPVCPYVCANGYCTGSA
jgi:hypothetical protein